MLSQPSGFSILATMPTGRLPRRSRNCCTSPAVRTKESATRSTPAVRPKCRSDRSFSVSDGMLTLTPGRLMPLWSPIGPPYTTSVRTADIVAVERRAVRRCRRPAGCGRRPSRRGRNSEYPVDARSALPSTGSVVMVKAAPACERAASVFKTAQADFGALQIEQNAAMHPGLPRGGPHRGDARDVLLLACRARRSGGKHPRRRPEVDPECPARRWPVREWRRSLCSASFESIVTDSAAASPEGGAEHRAARQDRKAGRQGQPMVWGVRAATECRDVRGATFRPDNSAPPTATESSNLEVRIPRRVCGNYDHLSRDHESGADF